MEDGFRADTLRLYRHAAQIQEQRRVAERLRQQLHLARRIADPADVGCYDEMIKRTDALARYFDAMSQTVMNMAAELERLSLDIGVMLEDASVPRTRQP